MFYGEEYRDQIRTTIKNVGYTYFLSETFFELFERKSFGVSLKDQRVIRYYLKYLKKLKFRYDGIHVLDALEAEILETLIVKSAFDHKTLIYSNFLEFLSCDVPVYSLMIEEGEDFFYKSIFLPIFVINLEIIIHELNHAIMIDAEATTEEEIMMPNLFIVEECEELFNDYIANLVLKNYYDAKSPLP